MPTVLDSRLKGNYGAAVVMTRLSSECLVRLVAADTDVGVDLYCETVTQGRPFLHFWVQVKAGEQCKVDPSAKTASCRFERDQILYWMRQPVPVFAALVPTDWPARRDPDIYVVDITAQVLFAGLPNAQDSVTLHSDYHWPAGAIDSVRAFLAQVVPDTTARLQCSKGVVATSPTPTPQYVRNTPVVPVTRFKDVILDQLRTTAANSVLFALAYGEQTPEDVEFRHLLARIVAQFADDPHWENFFARALSSHADQDFESALALYQRAKGSILDDPIVREEPAWQECVRYVEHLERCARDRQPLGKAG